MLSDQYVFTQLMTFLPKHEFRSCVQRYRGDRRIRNFSCLDQFRRPPRDIQMDNHL